MVPGSDKWYRGDPPAAIPAARLVGSSACVEFGERNLEAIPLEDIPDGRLLPEACYVKADDPFDTNIFDCRFVWFVFELIRRLYANTDDALAFSDTYFGTGTTRLVVPESADGKFPQSLFIRRGEEVYVFITGTQNLTQVLWQAMGFGTGPVNFGSYSTGILYEQAASRLAGELAAFAGQASRYVVTGHSYGGACAAVLAAKLSGTARVDLLTDGMPKPGDSRLVEIIDRLRNNHVVNEGDIVPYVMPDVIDGDFNPLVWQFAILGWKKWRRPRTITYIPFDGERWDRRATAGFQNNIPAFLAVALATGLQPEIGVEHFSKSYVSAVRRICPQMSPEVHTTDPDRIRIRVDAVVIQGPWGLYAFPADFYARNQLAFDNYYGVEGDYLFTGGATFERSEVTGDVIGWRVEIVKPFAPLSPNLVKLTWLLLGDIHDKFVTSTLFQAEVSTDFGLSYADVTADVQSQGILRVDPVWD